MQYIVSWDAGVYYVEQKGKIDRTGPYPARDFKTFRESVEYVRGRAIAADCIGTGSGLHPNEIAGLDALRAKLGMRMQGCRMRAA